MKKNIKTLKIFSLFLFCSLLIAICSLLSCEQPFKAGLGSIVDLRAPTITLKSPNAGAFIRGITEFTGEAEDDTKLEWIGFQLSNYPDVILPEYKMMSHRLGIFYKITDIKGSIRKIDEWKFSIDTRLFPDGDFKIRLVAIDAAGKEAVTDEIVFYVKNNIPQISMAFPSIAQGTEYGDLGGPHLNYDYYGTGIFPRVMDTKSLMVGLITDNEGIFRGEPGTIEIEDESGEKKTVELFPPQIRFWQVYFEDSAPPDDPDAKYKAFHIGEIPSDSEVPWRKLGGIDGVGSVMEIGVNNLQFTYPLPDKSGTFYGFQIRAQSTDRVKSKGLYPVDWMNLEGMTAEDKNENSYVLINVREPTEYPTLELYKLEDIYGKGCFRDRDSGLMIYQEISDIDPADKKDGNYRYVTKNINYKKGPFTLRMKAYHSGGIASAKVYWEKEDKSEKGRFIWDPVEERPYPEWIGKIPLKSDPYEKWGLNEPDGITTVRSFVFNYKDDGDDRIPNSDDYDPLVKGMSKIQAYKGPEEFLDDKGNTRKYDFDELPEERVNWEDVSRLKEGTYNIIVYTRSLSGTRIAMPFMATISIDREKPALKLNYIEGSASEYSSKYIDEEIVDEDEGSSDEKEDEYIKGDIVNGVIQPRFLISDSRPDDTGFRTGTVEYFRRPAPNDDRFYPEQAFILIPDDNEGRQKKAMDDYLKKHPWPEFTNLRSPVPAKPVIEGVTISKHGLIIEQKCLFRTSHIYDKDLSPTYYNEEEIDTLADGDYLLYAFARDNAFNTVSRFFPIRVDKMSDYPVFITFSDPVNIKVTQPDSSYDRPNDEEGDSFIVAGGPPRNKFNPNSNIRVRIKDDDSLDLGVQDAPANDLVNKSKIKVTFIGSTTVKNAAGEDVLVAYDDPLYLRDHPDGNDYLIPLGDTEIKEAFTPQPTYTGTNDPYKDQTLRKPIKEILGTINQTMLLNLLKNSGKYNDLFGGSDGAGYNSLPDGIYRVDISIQDYNHPSIKLKMEKPFQDPPDAKDADVSTKKVSFWIAVDSKNPVIKIDETKVENDGLTRLSGSFISPYSKEPLLGSVSDENGPINLAEWRVYDGPNHYLEWKAVNGTLKEWKLDDQGILVSVLPDPDPDNPPLPTLDIPDTVYRPGPVEYKPGRAYDGYKDGKWNYTFYYQMNMRGKTEGTFTFELKFQDRFGLPSTVSRRYSVDNIPPRVTLTKPIETFSRPFDDVNLDGIMQVTADPAVNKNRLAVKVVNFSINAVDNFRVKGVRWWLLPADTGSKKDAAALDCPTTNSGVVEHYDAFPGKTLTGVGTYYSSTITAVPGNPVPGFTRGAYGVVDVENRKFTIAVDTRKMLPDYGNGEYRLHIIAVDDAGNYSTYSDNNINLNNVFQVVFFLQEEDRPYFADGITPGVPAEGVAWPAGDMHVIGGVPIVRGTIFENNGFFGDKDGGSFWRSSISVWFSSTGVVPAGTDLEALVAAGSSIPGFAGPKNIPENVRPGATTGLGRQGRNLSLAIDLTTLFNKEELGADGNKRYIIKATDSPVNKLRYNESVANESVPGIAMGQSGSPGDSFDNAVGVRVYRWKQFAFIYDAVPPVIKIEKPAQGKTFGKNFAVTTDLDPEKTGFNITGSIEDANIDKFGDDYYFEYYLDNPVTPRPKFELKLYDGVTPDKAGATPNPPASPPDLAEGRHIYYIHEVTGGKTTVYFQIAASEVAKTIIPQADFDTLTEGQHTLNLFAWDKSGKEGAAMVNFIKDMAPPTISFANLTGDNKTYDEKNPSRIVNKDWWNKNATERQALLIGSSALPLSTIYYDAGVPELKGTITDIISNIALGNFGPNPAVGPGDVNNDTSSFKYWIDDETSPRYLALLDGAGSKSIRWTILLTNNGTLTGTPLADGVHTIVLTAADKAGEEIPDGNRYMIAFRIDSKPPKANILNKATASSVSVFGNIDYYNDPVFSINVQGSDANLKEVELRIVNKDKNDEELVKVTNLTMTSPVWTYTPFGYPPVITPLAKEDSVVFTGSYAVQKLLFTSTNASSGRYEVIVVAKDYAGNVSEEDVWTFTYDKTAPVIEFTNPDDKNKTSAILEPKDFIDVPTLEPKSGINRLTSENLRIQGIVRDSASPVRAAQSRVEKWNWDGTPDWTVVEEWTDLRQDLSTNELFQIAWTKNLLGQTGGTQLKSLNLGDQDTWNPKPAGAAVINPEGLYRIQIRAKDASKINLGTNGGNDGWVYPSGEGNPAVSDYMYFYYDRTNPELNITKINGAGTTMDSYYSTKIMGGTFRFEGDVTDNNRFAKVEVKLERDNVEIEKTANAISTINLNKGTVKQDWTASFSNTAKYTDGRYKVTVTVYDMTGRSAKAEKSFILDNTEPGARFTLPAKEAKTKYTGYGQDQDTPPANTGFASVIVNGGQTSVIAGETWDKSANNSESGVDQMWFRLGYIDGSAVFPTKAAIKADEDRLVAAARTPAGINGTTVKDVNNLMDYVSEFTGDGALGNAWFRLGGTKKYASSIGDPVPVPTGFIISPNIYDWRMEIPNILPSTHPDYNSLLSTYPGGQIGGLKLYGSQITVKGRVYDVGPSAARQMVRAVDGQAGVYRLPLWIRLADKVGNVEYYCHDIWIYPDGDIPTTTIESPSNGAQDKARGGAISVDGVARSNTSVYDVIFRVFADGAGTADNNKQKTDLDGTKVYELPSVNDAVRINGYDLVTNAATIDKIPNAPYYRNTDWQRANLTLPGGAGEPLIPWSIMLNSGDQIKDLIGSKGFNNTMIRVWLEVFVFNGTAAPIRSSIYQDDLLGTANGDLYGTVEAPRPYVRAFFIKSTAPQITYPNVGTWRTNTFEPWPTENPANPGGGGYRGAGTETRKDKFAFRATLDPNPDNNANSGLKEVAFRTKLDGGSYNTWKTIWETGNSLPYNTDGVNIRVRDTTGASVRYYFEYYINSRAAAAGNTTDNGTTFTSIFRDSDRKEFVNWANTGGTITLQIRIRDNSTPPNEAEQTIVVSVDNFAPVVARKDNRDVYGNNRNVAGSNVDFQGRVFDYATAPTTPTNYSMNTDFTPRKIDRIYAWFMKGTQYININTGALGAPATDSMTAAAANSRTAKELPEKGDTITSLTLDPAAPVTTTNVSYPRKTSTDPALAYKEPWVRELSQGTATAGTGMVFSPVNSAEYDIRWSFTVNTIPFPDGPMTLHYLVVDAAGNASYYTQDYLVRNKYPEINKVTLYTYNVGIGAAYTAPAEVDYNVNDYRSRMFANYTDNADYTAWNPSPSLASGKIDSLGYLNSGFISKNRYIGFKVETIKGNRALNYRLQHVTRQRITLTKANLDTMVADRTANNREKINLYTIAWHGNYSSQRWKALGVPIDNPQLGTHFVFNPQDGFDTTNNAGTAEVWKYTAVVSRPDVQPAAQNETDPVVVGSENFRFGGTGQDAEFNSINGYDGSHPDSDDTKKDNPKDTAFFLIRVWDSVGGSAGAAETSINEKLHDALVVGMNVYKEDKTRPIARLYDLNPYTEIAVTGNNQGDANQNATKRNAANPNALGSNIVRGGLYNTKTEREMVRSGYIDPRGGSTALDPRNGLYYKDVTWTDGQVINGVTLPDYPLKVSTDGVTTGTTNDKVSGKVILRGFAWDDQLIDTIRISINNGTPFAILKLDETAKDGSMKATSGNENSAYSVNELHWKTGHTVEWAYIWDTSVAPINNAPVNNVPIQVSAIDYNSPPGRDSVAVTLAQENASPETAKIYHNTINVDVVPFITGFERETPKFSTKRSLQGWYSFYQGEQNISLLGYNFGGSRSNVTITLSVNSTTYTLLNPAGFTGTPFRFNIPDNAKSGRINVTVGGIDAYNHTSSAANSWNKESNSYTPGSDLWNNKPHAHIWRSTEVGSGARTYFGTTVNNGTNSSSGLDHPGMALEYASGGSPGRLHGTWSVYGNANSYYGTNDGTANLQTRLITGDPPGEPIGVPDISILNGGGNTVANIGYTHQRDGRPSLFVRSMTNLATTAEDTNNGTTADMIQGDDNNNNPTGRWRNIRVSKYAGNDTSQFNMGRVYMTAGDAKNNSLWFGTRSGTTNNTVFIDGGNATGGVGGIGAAAMAGEYSAIDYDNTGPIIAYYDQTNDTVRIAFGSSDTPTAAGNWTRRNLLPTGHALYRGSGKYISIKVENNHIHLAFYNSVYNTVVYYYAANRGLINAASPPTPGTAVNADVRAHTIDRVVTGGTWTDISVDSYGNPWIVYGDNSRTGNYDGVRMAYRSGADTGLAFTGVLTCPVTNTVITGWEALTMPANYRVNNDRLNIEAWPPTVRSGTYGSSPGWNAAIGYASDMFRIGYFYYPTWKGY